MKIYLAFVLLFPLFIGLLGFLIEFLMRGKCPKCGSSDIDRVWDWKVEECHACGHTWRPE